ncbi:hypothetical protein BKK47_02695 [Rodentibacter mrazii]|uniref:DUF488 family protein n=1 Tax=Rodentibacter mrazii TaxID=1908257 RepID=A0A1V3IIF8_9PAST|nr:hypothetical protein [Rodentibacter mrazii]OOF40955.1 hypothetical protein BKK47_02695 [Rodentibacter mrazii]
MKTSYFAKYKNGDGAISIATYPPRYLRGKIVSYPPLAPQFNFRIPYDEYVVKYQEQLSKLDPQKVWDDLHQLANGAEPVLLCYEAPPFDKVNFCHRFMAAEWLEKELGAKIIEWTPNTYQYKDWK